MEILGCSSNLKCILMQEKARARMVKQKDSDKGGSWMGSWSDVWGKANEYQQTTGTLLKHQ